MGGVGSQPLPPPGPDQPPYSSTGIPRIPELTAEVPGEMMGLKVPGKAHYSNLRWGVAGQPPLPFFFKRALPPYPALDEGGGSPHPGLAAKGPLPNNLRRMSDGGRAGPDLRMGGWPYPPGYNAIISGTRSGPRPVPLSEPSLFPAAEVSAWPESR
jgi:hypothetical protein